MRLAAVERRLRIGKPLHAAEFLLIEIDPLIALGGDHIPQRHINMPSGQADGRSTCDHQWFGDVVSGNQAEFFKELALHGLSRMFSRLDVAARREPELRTFVIHE